MFRVVLAAGLLLVSAWAFAGSVNINTATEQQLDEELLGIGQMLAERIVRYRQAHGPFRSPEEIQNVPYVGVKTFQKNRKYIVVKD